MSRRSASRSIPHLLLLTLGALGAACSSGCSSHGARRAFVGGTVVPSPTAAAIADGVVLVEGTRVVALGTRDSVSIPADAERIDCRGATVVAGFWNSHVHFMRPEWQNAATAAAGGLAGALRDMLGRWGFVHAVDLGSTLDNTRALARRVMSGEIAGPDIRTAGLPFIAVGGQPSYIDIPLPPLATAADAIAGVKARLDAGADLIKLMTASVVAHPPPPVMPVEVVRAVTTAAHARGALVFAHPTDGDGVRAAIDGGVDVLAHTAPPMGPWSAADVRRLLDAHMALTPTLSLWRPELTRDGAPPEEVDRAEATAVSQLGSFHAAGGIALFGTDVGYTDAFDPAPEYTLLGRAGLDGRAILAMLTSAPAALFGAGRAGSLRVDGDADVVILDGDPLADVTAWTRVRASYRQGQLIYSR